MLLYVFFGGKNVPMEFMCHFSRKAWIRWDPPVHPDRVSPLGIAVHRASVSPPEQKGAELSSFPCCPPSFVDKPAPSVLAGMKGLGQFSSWAGSSS